MVVADIHSDSVTWRSVQHVEIFGVWAILNKVTDKILNLRRRRVMMI